MLPRSIIVAFFCGAVLSFIPHNAPAIELIQNGSFEDPNTGIGSDAHWDDGSGAGNDIGLGDSQYPFYANGVFEGGTLLGDPPPGVRDSTFTGTVAAQGAGAQFGFRWGFGNGSGFRGSATQHLNLVPHRDKQYQFSAWLASSPFDDPDYAIVSFKIFDEPDAMGTLLRTVEFDGNDANSPLIVGSLNIEGFADPAIPATQDNWTLYHATGTIPVSAHSAAVTIKSALDIYGYVDLVSLQVFPELPTFPGDYNGNDEVGQGDLDLVLLNWGIDSIVAPDGWIRNLPAGPVDQAELDAVLLNWGNTQPPVNGIGTIPEPATLSLVLAVLPFVVAIRRTHAKRRNSIGEEKVSGIFSKLGCHSPECREKVPDTFSSSQFEAVEAHHPRLPTVQQRHEKLD